MYNDDPLWQRGPHTRTSQVTKVTHTQTLLHSKAGRAGRIGRRGGRRRALVSAGSATLPLEGSGTYSARQRVVTRYGGARPPGAPSLASHVIPTSAARKPNTNRATQRTNQLQRRRQHVVDRIGQCPQDHAAVDPKRRDGILRCICAGCDRCLNEAGWRGPESGRPA